MTIEIRCDNVTGFNAATGTYEKCDQKINVPQKYAGKSVKCPKCSQGIQVPSASSPSESPAAVAGISSSPGVMDMEFESESEVSSAAFQSGAQRCPKCGGKYSEDGVCTLCGFQEPVQRAQRERKKKKVVRSAGFQYWLRQLSNEPKNAPLVGNCIFAACNVFGLLILATGILLTSFTGVLLTVLAAFFLVGIWMAYLKTRQLAANPEASLGMFAPFWHLLLVGARQMQWEKYDGKLRGRVVIDARNSEVNDATLPGLAGFKNAEVFDLQGRQITDNGLRHFYGHANLRCIVLKDTQVTATGVANLQQALPRIWIWR